MMIKKLFLFLLISPLLTYAQNAQQVTKKVGKNPIIHIDSVRVDYAALQKLDPKIITAFSIYVGKEATDLFGNAGNDGVIYAETVPFARKRFLKYFKSKSEDYAKIVNESANDSNIQYILDTEILRDNFAGKLAKINDQTFKEIKILSKDELIKNYQINDKKFGVQIILIKPNLDKEKQR